MPPEKMKQSQAVNFLWLDLDLPAKADPTDGSIRRSMPEEYIGNIREAGNRHPHAEICLWIDKKRQTEKQTAYLRHQLKNDTGNIHIKDLRTIPGYNDEALYNQPETNENWRGTYRSNIWLQVDAAKILISLQEILTRSSTPILIMPISILKRMKCRTCSTGMGC